MMSSHISKFLYVIKLGPNDSLWQGAGFLNKLQISVHAQIDSAESFRTSVLPLLVVNVYKIKLSILALLVMPLHESDLPEIISL